jgi:hypothetical protein
MAKLNKKKHIPQITRLFNAKTIHTLSYGIHLHNNKQHKNNNPPMMSCCIIYMGKDL